MRKAYFARLLLFSLLLPFTRAHDVITTKLTYSRDISRIFARRCLACHAMESSIPLASYEQVRPWAVDIKQQVLSRRMPPWGAVKGFGDLSPDRGLNQEEVMIIAAWVIGGAPQGSPALTPPASATISPQPDSPQPDSPMMDSLVISTRSTLGRDLTVAGVRPLSTSVTGSARILAKLPDGSIEPLLWLFQYDPKWKQTFRFRKPILLPAGTVVQADSPVQFALETRP